MTRRGWDIDCNAECNRAHRGTHPRRQPGFSSAVWNLATVHRPLHATCRATTTRPALHELAVRHQTFGELDRLQKASGDIKDTTTLTYQCSGN